MPFSSELRVVLPLIVLPLKTPARGAVFHHGAVPANSPLALLGRFLSLVGRFPLLMGRFPGCLDDRLSLVDPLETAFNNRPINQSRFLGRGCDEALFSEKRGLQ